MMRRLHDRDGRPMGSRTFPATATGASAVGTLALGAIALGALAIGALAIGRLAVGSARIRRVEIDELVVRHLRVTDRLSAPEKPDTKTPGDLERQAPDGEATHGVT